MILNIYDLSTYIYRGSVNTYYSFKGNIYREIDGSVSQVNVPAGGIHYFLKQFKKFMNNPGVINIVALDRYPKFRKELYPDYKNNRQEKQTVNFQREVMEGILEDCGIQTIAVDGWESDDVIASLVNKYKEEAHHIFVFGSDSDHHALVSDKCSVFPTGDKGKIVTMDNFTAMTGVPYNRVSLTKVMTSERGDGIGYYQGPDREETMAILYNEKLKDFWNDKETMIAMATKLNKPELIKRIKLLYPETSLDVKIDFSYDLNKSRINAWMNLVGGKEEINYTEESMRKLREYNDAICDGISDFLTYTELSQIQFS